MPLRLALRSPNEAILDEEFDSIRVPTQSGQVGLRSHVEPTVLTVEAGLIVLRGQSGTRYAGTAGGLLRTDGNVVTVLTPLAVVGDDVASVSQQLEQMMRSPSEEMEVRRTLGRLENRILQELQHSESSSVAELGKR